MTQSNMSNKPNKVHSSTPLTFIHNATQIPHSHMHRKKSISHTHTHTQNDRELLTASTWPDRPFTISLTVKPNVLKECVCVYECVKGAN